MELNKYQYKITINPSFIAFIIGAGFFVYSSMRAYLLSMTHDESGTYIYWMDHPIFECFFTPGKWPDANLHWLYVFFMKFCVRLFGDAEWAIRLPSLIAHLIYLFFSWKIVSQWTNNKWAAVFGFIFINANLYLLDFFGLARGYGMSLAFMVVSIYYFGKWIKELNIENISGQKAPTPDALQKGKGKTYQIKYPVLFFGTAALSVLANLTAINYFTILLAVFTLILIHHFFILKNKLPFLYIFTAIVFSGLLFFLLKTPIEGLRAGKKLYFGAETLMATFTTIVEDTLYDARPIIDADINLITWTALVFYFAALGVCIFQFIKNKSKDKYQFQLAIALLPFILAMSTWAQHQLFGTPYLHRRTALFYWPLFSLSIFFLFDYLWRNESRWWERIVPIIFSVAFLIHTIQYGNLSYSRPWWYDRTTRDMVVYLKEKHGDEIISLGCNWIFYPSSNFYCKKYDINLQWQLGYEKKIRDNSTLDYYYVDKADLPKLHPDYVLEKQFSNSSFLMKRKDK